MTDITITVDIIGLVIAAILFLYNLTEKSKDKAQTILLRSMLAANCIALTLDLICWLLDGRAEYIGLMTNLRVACWMAGYLIILFYLIYLVKHLSNNKKRNKMMIWFFVAYTALLDICYYNSYEGECAVLLEKVAHEGKQQLTLVL